MLGNSHTNHFAHNLIFVTAPIFTEHQDPLRSNLHTRWNSRNFIDGITFINTIASTNIQFVMMIHPQRFSSDITVFVANQHLDISLKLRRIAHIDKIYVRLSITTLLLSIRHHDAFYQLLSVSINWIEPIHHVVFVSMRGAIAQRAHRIQVVNRTCRQYAFHVLWLVHDDNRIDSSQIFNWRNTI